jgi:murein L,D-transpeptidase YafK
MKILLLGSFFLGFLLSLSAQKTSSYSTYSSFIEYQKAIPRMGDAFKRKEDTLQKQFEKKGLVWPAKFLYLRSFKYDSQLEVWVKNELKDPFTLFKTYKVCALAGTLGPKRIAGDYQVPEGFYYINEFNPQSNYHLSLGINYPNISDRILSDSLQPGGDIYIHGSCVTVGCIPMTDDQIEEIYLMAALAKDLGQDFIPVHIFPIRYNVKRSSDYLNNLTKDDISLKRFASKLEDAFNYFERHKQLPIVLVNENGEYVVNGIIKKDPAEKKEKIKRTLVQHRVRSIPNVAQVVNQWPQFPGGGDAFLGYLKQLGKDMVDQLPTGMVKAFVIVEFIIDKDGVPTNFNVVKGVSEDFDDELITRMEKMPEWLPAILNDKPVAKKIKQSFAIEQE